MTAILYLPLTAESNHMASTSRQREAPFAFALQTVLCVAFSTIVAPGQACHQQLPNTTHRFYGRPMQ